VSFWTMGSTAGTPPTFWVHLQSPWFWNHEVFYVVAFLLLHVEH